MNAALKSQRPAPDRVRLTIWLKQFSTGGHATWVLHVRAATPAQRAAAFTRYTNLVRAMYPFAYDVGAYFETTLAAKWAEVRAMRAHVGSAWRFCDARRVLLKQVAQLRRARGAA